jgi:hypothetical protein
MPSNFSKPNGKFIDKINNVIVYNDDLLIHSQTHEQHLDTLELVMHRLKENHLKNNVHKCFVGSMEVNYLGYRLTTN